MSVKDTEWGREAGLLERYHITRHSLHLDNGVVLAAKFANDANERLDGNAIFFALAHALQTHACLSARIVDEKGKHPRFALMPEVRLDQVINFVEKDPETTPEESVAKIMEDEFLNYIDPSKTLPLWRITVTSDNLVFFSYYHAIGDGQSGLAMLRTILEGLNKYCRESPNEMLRIVKSNPALELTPPVEALTDVSASLKMLLDEAKGIYIPQSLRFKDVWTGAKVLTKSNLSTSIRNRVHIISISADNASRLLHRARDHKTTLTAVFYVLGLAALSECIADLPESKKYKRSASAIAISLRPHAGIPPTAMCEAVSVYVNYDHLIQNPSEELLWKATTFSAKLHTKVPKSPKAVGSLKYLFGRYEEYFLSKLGKKRECGMDLSNLGAFKINVDGESDSGTRWRIDETYFAQDDRYIGGALKLNVTGSPSGKVTICITWGEGGVGDEFAKSFAQRLEASIIELAKVELEEN